VRVKYKVHQQSWYLRGSYNSMTGNRKAHAVELHPDECLLGVNKNNSKATFRPANLQVVRKPCYKATLIKQPIQNECDTSGHTRPS